MSEAAAAALSTVREALRPLCESFAADGYRMSVESLEQGNLTIVIEAGEGACEECLVSKEIMCGIVENTLPSGSGVKAVELIYPRDPRA